MAQDSRRVESVAAEFYEEARRVHGILPSLRTEVHCLISVRGALCGDLEHRVNQLRECELKWSNCDPGRGEKRRLTCTKAFAVNCNCVLNNWRRRGAILVPRCTCCSRPLPIMRRRL